MALDADQHIDVFGANAQIDIVNSNYHSRCPRLLDDETGDVVAPMHRDETTLGVYWIAVILGLMMMNDFAFYTA